MKIKFTFFILLVVAAISVKAQNLIAVQHAGSSTFYTKLPDAITNAMAGDTVYIPGGSFDAISINKTLYLIGVGHHPDSTKVTSRTVIQRIDLSAGADNGSITGVYFTPSLNSSNGFPIPNIYVTGSVKGYTISRCNIYSIQTDKSNGISNFTITENIIGDLRLDGSSSFLSNNIFGGVVNSYNSTIKNNIFLSTYFNFQTLVSGVNCTVENNIFQQGTIGFTGSIFNNNLNGIGNGISGTNQGSNNFNTSDAFTSIFTGYDPATTIAGDIIYKQDFRISSSSPYKNAGKDGTDIGIYGGAFPWKPGSVPFNPHFQSLKIAPQTDSSGNLKVQITVAAQNN